MIAEAIVEELQGTQLMHFGNRHGFPIVSTATGVRSIVKRGERGFYPAISQAPQPRALLGDGLEHSLMLCLPTVRELELLQQRVELLPAHLVRAQHDLDGVEPVEDAGDEFQRQTRVKP